MNSVMKSWCGYGHHSSIRLKSANQRHAQPVVITSQRPLPLHFRCNATGDSTASASNSVLSVFQHNGVDTETLRRAHSLYPHLLALPVDRVTHVLEHLRQLGLSDKDISKVLLRYPGLFRSNSDAVHNVTEFLRTVIGLSDSELRSVVTKYPQVYSFGVKSHLQPQLAILSSYGVDREILASFVVQRPLLLGEGIETVVNFLKLCGVPRQQMFLLLRSYPIDYCLRMPGLYSTAKGAAKPEQ